MKITLDLNSFESADALANAMQELAEQLRVKSAAKPKQAEKKVATTDVAPQSEKSITHTGRQPTEKAVLTRKAVVNLAKMQWRPDGFTANDLSAYLGVDRMSAMNALIYWSEEGKHPSPLVYRAGTQENPGKGKDPVLWKWI